MLSDEPDVHFDWSRASDALKLPRFKDAQELELYIGEIFTNLIQENGAAIGSVEPPHVVSDGACKRPFHMAEEFAFEASSQAMTSSSP